MKYDSAIMMNDLQYMNKNGQILKKKLVKNTS